LKGVSLRLFRATEGPATFNVVGMGAAIGAMAAAVLHATFHLPRGIVAVPSLLVGCVWAALLRRGPGWRPGAFGWWVAVALAAFDAAIALAAFDVVARAGTPVPVWSLVAAGFFEGATFGAIIWIPALIAVLLCFGPPIARARRLAREGLTGCERGEWPIGLVSATLGALAIAVTAAASPPGETWMVEESPHEGWVVAALGAAALVCGAAAAATSLARLALRRRFVARILRGEEPGLAIVPAERGADLVRVDDGAGYRAGASRVVAHLDDGAPGVVEPERPAGRA
jgi:hypothetical protein